jgi:alpha-glucosidase (family GH31 glycosyl hydrolase)
MNRNIRLSLLIGCLLMTLTACARTSITEDPSGRMKFQKGDEYLIVEFLDDDLVHFEYSGVETQTDLTRPLHTSPMVLKTDYPGPGKLTSDGKGSFETAAIKVKVEASTLCLTAWDISRQPALTLTTLCPVNLGKQKQGFTLTPESFTHAYGLGEEFGEEGESNGDWVGRVRAAGSFMGNAMVGWNDGAVGNAQFPIVYFAGQGLDDYALFADNVYTQRWDFKSDPWKVTLGGNWMRFYLMTGPDLQDLRRDYMELTGKPPVPPKKMFGLWVSEYGYDNWGELEDKLTTLREHQFPVDGFVLDLQWFGGIKSSSENSRMGALDWDLTNFPDPTAEIQKLNDTQGVGIMTIEESYISKGLPEHAQLADKGYLVHACETCPPVYLNGNAWWGLGGMMDWTNPEASAYLHDWKREPLIEAGVIGHWTDLGEPELFKVPSWYFGVPDDYIPLHEHVDIHNLYNLLWSQSIYDGYQRNGETQRPFIMSRSGAPGSQRYGVAMWSGDIGSDLSNLATQFNVQMHMSLSGMDYFGSDIGGFHRGGSEEKLDETYTQWFANSSLLEIPVRAHTENLCNCKETAPDRIGDVPSNLANIRLRYALSPYLYSLGHRAFLDGEPVFPPLVYYYQTDQSAREIADEKLIGRDLLVAQAAAYGITERKVYLPAGDWYDYYTTQRYTSKGEEFGPFPLYQDDRFQLPLFARAGAIIPQMHVDEKTMNIFGLRSDGTVRDELIVRVYAGPAASSFTLYEDDGGSTAYQNGEVRTTLLSQQDGQVIIAASEGDYAGAPSSRDNVVTFISETAGQVTEVTLNGVALTQVASMNEWEQASSGWYYVGDNLILIKSGSMSVSEEKMFEYR